jgi:FKBP-type peptidyl-prolyl cis-trans isomerase SlyD
MSVKKDIVVEMHYTLKNESGKVIDSSSGKEPMVFIQGHGNIIPGLEVALEGMKVGENRDVTVKPEEAYGIFRKEGIQEIPLEALKGIEDLAVGMELKSQDEQGNAFIVRVQEIKKEVVIINANHPLAGETLHFNINIESVREATKDELSHGHVHSQGCSH